MQNDPSINQLIQNRHDYSRNHKNIYRRFWQRWRNIFFPPVDPLVIDLDGDGLEIASIGDNPVLFDHDGDGVKTATGWVKPDDGLLVFDRNNDGLINDESELFGDQTVKYDGTGKCADGFEALAQEDTNGDGIVNHLDDNWHNIKVWRDLNQDGQTDEGELFTLEELGISGFDINAIQAARSTNGSIISAVGTYYKTDGTTGQIGNLLFASDPSVKLLPGPSRTP